MRCSSSPGSAPSRSRRSRRYRSKRSSAVAGPLTAASLRSRSASSGSSCGDCACAAVEHRQRGRVRTRPAGRPGQDHPRGGRIRGGGPPDLRERAVVPVSCPGQAGRQRQGLPRQPFGGGRVPVEHGRGGAHELCEPGAVDLSRRGPQPVPGALADDRVGTARVPGPRHQHLQALRAVARRVVSPDELDQLFGPHRHGSRGPRAQRAAPAGDRPQPVSPASAHPQAGSGRCSPAQSRSASRASRIRSFLSTPYPTAKPLSELAPSSAPEWLLRAPYVTLYLTPHECRFGDQDARAPGQRTRCVTLCWLRRSRTLPHYLHPPVTASCRFGLVRLWLRWFAGWLNLLPVPDSCRILRAGGRS